MIAALLATVRRCLRRIPGTTGGSYHFGIYRRIPARIAAYSYYSDGNFTAMPPGQTVAARSRYRMATKSLSAYCRYVLSCRRAFISDEGRLPMLTGAMIFGRAPLPPNFLLAFIATTP